MKAILISVRPKWVELILSYIKKDEIRKGTAIGKAINRLIKEQGVAPMLLYCTKGEELLCKKNNSWSIIKLKRGFAIGDIYNGKVVARFNATVDLLELKMIEGGLFFAKPDKEVAEIDLNENAQIDNFELLRYTGYKLGTQISDIHINDLKVFDKPKEISEFWTNNYNKGAMCDNEPQFPCTKCPNTGALYCNCKFLLNGNCSCISLTRAPQSYCYVEVEDENFN